MVTLVWGGGEGVLGEAPPSLVFNYSKEALGWAQGRPARENQKGIGPEKLDFSQSGKFLRKFLRSRNPASRAFRALSSFLG